MPYIVNKYFKMSPETVTEEREINLGNPENGRYIYELGSDVLSTEFALKAATADGGWGDYSPFVRPETCKLWFSLHCTICE